MSAVPRTERPLQILQVVGNAIVGGMETFVERLVERLPPERFGVTALLPVDGALADRLRALGCETVIAPMPEDPPWTSVSLACELVRERGIALLHAHLPNAHLLAGLAARLAGRPVLTTIHGRQLATLDLELHRAVGSHLSVVCRQTYYHALALGADTRRLSFDPNGVDCTQFRPRDGLRARAGGLRTTLGLAPEAPLVGCVGRLSPEKGPEVFVRAALPLLARRPDAHAVLIGDGPLRRVLEAQIEQLRLVGRVHLAGLRDDIAECLGELDLLALSSHSEAMPLALMEAMASGLPVVATRVGGVPDMVAHGVCGWVVAPGDFEDLGARCASLLDAAAQRQRFGAAARARALERFALDDAVARTAALYERLAGTARGVTSLDEATPGRARRALQA